MHLLRAFTRWFLGTYRVSEAALADQLLPELKAGMVLLADRVFCSFALWRKASDTGADLLWRVRIDPVGPKPQHVRGLPDGSWLAHLRRSTDRTSEPMLAR